MSEGPGDEQQPPEWQRPQWQQPQWPQPQQDQPQWGQPQWGQQPPQYYQQGQTTPGSATAALILGICSLVLCFVCAPFAIVYGNRARREIDASGGRLGGRGLATAGIIMGWIDIGLTVIALIVIIAAIAASGN